LSDLSVCFEQNHLLAALPKSAQARLFPHLKKTHMNFGDVINESDDTMEYVYFPVNCIVSLQSITLSGASTEISVVGREGVIGVAILMGSETTPTRTVVQSKGSAFKIRASELKFEFDHHSEVQRLLLRYTQALNTQMCQTVVCNRFHAIQEQLCRWLLLFLDRLQSNHLRMTQEHIAHLLSVRRESVNEAVNKLQKKGIIECSRGRITVLDRPGLEALSCECYAIVKGETDRLASRSTPVESEFPVNRGNLNRCTL
jgi:CRP-like cAMP-binding protein